MSTLVAEIYGPDYEAQKDVAMQVKDLFATTESVVDIDWMMEDDQTEYTFDVDKEKAMLAGIAPQQIIMAMNMALRGANATYLYAENDHKQVGIKLRLDESNRTDINDLKKISLKSQRGDMVAVGDLVNVKEEQKEKSIFRKNQKQVVYVTADVAGKLESPVYAILDMSERMNEIKLPAGYSIEEFYNGQPFVENNFGLKWDGEWQITYEVFRDLGTAFAVVLVIIYMLIVGWFQNLKVPFVMMVAIPLSLVGIVLGHLMLDAFFTATSMIGMIALAGIMVRNSILLIDFVNIRLKDGIALREAVIEAGAVRTTPILLTAGTVVIGAVVILFDPIFQGLAISLMGGTIASTVLTLLIVPLIYYMTERKRYEGAIVKSDEALTEKINHKEVMPEVVETEN
jgi:multidrug efflux pump subunit AcrB